MNTFKRLALVVTLVVAMGAGFGCAKKQTGADVAPATTADDNGAANAAIERAAQAITDGIVYFDFDKSDIKAESRDDDSAMKAESHEGLSQHPRAHRRQLRRPVAPRNTTSPSANAAPALPTNTWLRLA